MLLRLGVAAVVALAFRDTQDQARIRPGEIAAQLKGAVITRINRLDSMILQQLCL
jgi:hypothetical protein